MGSRTESDLIWTGRFRRWLTTVDSAALARSRPASYLPAVAPASPRVPPPEDGTRVWFYDQSEKRLYNVPADTIPPHKGTGGKSGDGVRAVVVTFPGRQVQAAERRIAYLESYSPQLKDLLERIHAARATSVRYNGSIPSRDSDFFQTNSLIKRPDEEVWHPASSKEALAIVSEWRSWRSSDGLAPVVCVP